MIAWVKDCVGDPVKSNDSWTAIENPALIINKMNYRIRRLISEVKTPGLLMPVQVSKSKIKASRESQRGCKGEEHIFSMAALSWQALQPKSVRQAAPALIYSAS